ncbi:MAG: PcfJ-like protein [Bacteroidales bacterium]|nr:PcfJ-like protein [Bacteroidales bacterium]
MKPKNVYQQHIVELSEKLPAITDKQKQWAFEHCFETDGYFTKGTVWCLHCGEVFPKTTSELIVSLAGDEAICPKCGRKLKLENSRKSKYKESWYYTILTTMQGFQVCRHFIVEKVMYKGNKEAYYTINEAVQNWIDENGKETIIARPCKPLMFVNDCWNFSKPMEIRYKCYSPNAYAPNKYNIDAKYIYPRRKILPKIKRNGYTGRFHGLSASELFKLLLKDREAEMLIKNAQFDLLRHKYMRGIREFKMPFPHSIRIAIRNKYIVKDASMWIDYLYLLEDFHLDTHNAHYVCPRNLKAEHDRLLARKQRFEEKIALEKKIAEAKKWEERYREIKGKFFGICFGNESIVITVIQSVAEMAEEGKAMHHCVYNAGYYKKPDSLILSAKDKAGNCIETIEIDLKTFKVVQSRGVCNMNTDKHDEIVKLVQDNINLIMQAA